MSVCDCEVQLEPQQIMCFVSTFARQAVQRGQNHSRFNNLLNTTFSMGALRLTDFVLPTDNKTFEFAEQEIFYEFLCEYKNGPSVLHPTIDSRISVLWAEVIQLHQIRKDLIIV